MAVGTQMRFEFQLRDASPLIGGEGTVVWTRENDPSRPAIAPGMGVRFDRLADGSQVVLERILAEKAKQTPQRPPSKPPMFADTPTRVASPSMQEALLANDTPRRRSDSGFNEQHTPLPTPVPFHSDADEFPEEAFEEATKVRSLDELIAQTASRTPMPGRTPAAASAAPELVPLRSPVPMVLAGDRLPAGTRVPVGDLAITQPELFTDRPDAPRADATIADPSPAGSEIDPAATLDPSSTSPGFASGRIHLLDDAELAPGLPSPPETSAPVKPPRLLDTSPSPRTESGDPMEKLMKTKIGLEPVHVSTRPVAPSPTKLPARPPGTPTSAAEPTNLVRMPSKKSSAAPIVILVLVLLAAAAAGVWFFWLRNRAVDDAVVKHGSGSGSDVIAKAGSDLGSGSDGSPPGSNGSSGSSAPAAVLVEFEVVSSAAKATVEVIGTSQTGAAPFKTKLEKDKMYKVRVSAPGFLSVEQDVKGGQDKLTAKLEPKPRTIDVSSEPSGGLISIDNAPIGHSTPYELELTKAQAAKKSVRIRVYKTGFAPIEKVVDAGAYKEQPTKMSAKLDVGTLAVQRPFVRPPPPQGSGSSSPGSGSGSDSTTGSDGSGSAGSGSSVSSGSGSNEPTPDFVKPNP